MESSFVYQTFGHPKGTGVELEGADDLSFGPSSSPSLSLPASSFSWERETERQRETERDRDREIERDKETKRQKETERGEWYWIDSIRWQCLPSAILLGIKRADCGTDSRNESSGSLYIRWSDRYRPCLKKWVEVR